MLNERLQMIIDKIQQEITMCVVNANEAYDKGDMEQYERHMAVAAGFAKSQEIVRKHAVSERN